MKKFTLFFLMIMAFTAIKAQLPDNWTDDSGIDVFQETTTVHSGTYSAGVIVNTDTQGDCDLDNLVAIDVAEDDDYKISFWAYTSEGVRVTAVMHFDTENVYSGEYVGPATSGWEQYVVEGIVPAGATTLNVGLRFYDVAGFTPPETQYVDDVLFESPVGEPLTVSNGDFESWPSLGGEPTNYPTDFSAVPNGLSANLTWTDAIGEQLPDMYLIYASTSETIAPPVDGEPVIDDLDLTDGMGAVNVAFGTETVSFTGLMAQTNYYFAIYPYTNSGTNIDFKNDGTAPTAIAQTSNVVILNEENFDFGWGEWSTVNVFGDQVWVRDEQYGIGGTPCAKVSGFEGGSDFANEDWLISPSFDFTAYENELFTFWTAMGYATGALQLSVKASTDYDGGGDPGSATWTDLDAVLSTGDPFFGWTYSGELDVSGFEGESVYFAFVYFSDGTDSETWEVDDIMITGEGSFTPDPEPTNYPAEFAASATEQLINTNWVDATGETVPTGYLLKMSDQDNIAAPIDTEPEANDTDYSDGTGVINVMAGEEAYDFEGLMGNTTYYFKIFPYTNSGTYIDYKIDGTVPSGMATTEQIIGETILFTTFNDSWENWTPMSILGEQVWDRDNTYGPDDTPCAKMSGYIFEVGSFENEDWLISPGIDLRNFHNEEVSFSSAYKYDGIALELMVSEDYNDGGNPGDFTWTNLTGEANWSAGEFEWTESGQIDISAYADSILYVAFVFQSTTEESSTWEVDNIKIIGEEGSGIEDVAQRYAQIFPNPSNGTFNIELTEEFDLLEVFSITGQMIYSDELSGFNVSVNLPDTNQGMYFIRLTNQETGMAISKRVIIQ